MARVRKRHGQVSCSPLFWHYDTFTCQCTGSPSTCYHSLTILFFVLGKTYNGALERAQSPWGPTEEAVAWLPLIPPFIKLPVPGKITRDSLQHLVHMGALELPPVALEKQLLVAYAEHVHADFPILDLHDFIRRISHRDGRNGQLSLLLYQSVMFAASAFVDFAHVVAAGFKTRRAFRRSIFQAVKLLFDCDYESDKLVLAQSSLLLSFWYDAPDDSKETWYWAGIAISQAEALGLHRTALTANLDPAKRRLRKRIWWSLVIRDRQIGLGMSRLLRIKDNDFDVPMLQENDFEIAVMDDNTVLSHEDCPMLYDVGMQQELAEMCVEKTKLYVLIGRVLKGVQAFQDVANTRANPGADIIVEGLYSLDRIHRELAAWAAALPPTCQYRKLEQWDILHGRTPVAMQRTLLQMIYQTTVGKIYHPLMRSLRIQESHAEQQISQIARYKCKSVATEITRAIAEMHELQLDKYFPTTGVTVVMPAILVHLQDITSPVQETREEAQRGFDICMSVLNVLRETYAAAEIAAIFMGNLIKKKPGVESPAPLATDMLSNASSILPASGHAPRQAAALSQTFANGFMAMMQPRHGSGLSLHPDMSAMDLTTLPIIAPTALAGGIQGVRIPNSGQPPALAAKSSSTASASAATQQATVTESWSMDMTAHEQSSDESITMSPSNSSLESSSLRDKDQSGDAYGLVSQSISAEGLSFPRLDDGWQNWLNLPPEFDTNDNSGGSWANFADHIDPGALDAQAREIFS